jgi:hypothetical protein
MADPTGNRALADFESSINQPVMNRPVKVVPSDTVNFTRNPRGLRVGVAGVATLVYSDGTAVGFPLFVGDNPIGNMMRINATGCTAKDMWLLF